jgi:hypothetical protein
MTTTVESLPTGIQSIATPRYTNSLRWRAVNPPWAVAEVDHDWRVWVNLEDGMAVVRNKGSEDRGKDFATLALALASLDYRYGPITKTLGGN